MGKYCPLINPKYYNCFKAVGYHHCSLLCMYDLPLIVKSSKNVEICEAVCLLFSRILKLRKIAMPFFLQGLLFFRFSEKKINEGYNIHLAVNNQLCTNVNWPELTTIFSVSSSANQERDEFSRDLKGWRS